MTLPSRFQTVLVAFVIALSLLLLSDASFGKEQLFLAENSVPEGFEALNAPQRSLIDIYYGNRYLTSQLATFEPGKLTLSNPDEVVRLIGSINDPALILSALSGELNTNGGQVCLSSSRQNCGVLAPSVAGIIFDESRFRVDVFVNPRFLLTRAADIRKFLPPSDAEFSLMQNFSATLSGSDQQNADNDYTVNGLTMLAYKENSVYWNWNRSKSTGFSVSELYGQREFEGIEYSGGLLYSRSFGLNFTSDQPMLGIRLESSTNTRTDTDFSGGMPIEVFLPTRGRVEVRRDDRLIASFFHEAGLQALDTSGFPNGAYDIEIRILDEQGNELSRESRFFAKQFQLPPEGEWNYFLESGRVVNRTFSGTFPGATEQWLSRGGISRRLSDTSAGTGAVAMMNDESLLELGIYHFGYRYELSPSVMLADNGDYGFTVNGRTSFGDILLSADYRRLWLKDEVSNTVSNTIVSDGTVEPTLLGSAFEQSGFSASVPLWKGSINYRFSAIQAAGGGTTESHSVDYRAALFRGVNYDTSFQVSLSESEGNKIALFSFEWRYSGDRWDIRANPRAQVQDSNGTKDRTETMRVSTSWNSGGLYTSDLAFNGSAESGSGRSNVNAGLQYANHYGQAGVSINHNNTTNSNSVTSYVGSFSTSFLTDGTVIAMGGEQKAESAVVVNIDGRDGDTFDVNINGSRRGYAVVGQPSVIPLTPFEEYRITLSPSGDSFYSFDEREKTFTLYPGNVLSLDYDAIALHVLFGRLVFNGEPVDAARIIGGIYPASSNDLGLFQLEVRSDTQTLQVELDNGWVCSLDIPTKQGKSVLRVGTVDLSDAQCVSQGEGQWVMSRIEFGD